MKLTKCFLLASILLLGSCAIPNEEVKMESLKASKDEVSLILGSERNLNDIVTLIFEPNTIQNREVTWSTEENEVFTLNEDVIKTKKVGKGTVKATSVFDSKFFTNVVINVYDNSEATYKVNIEESIDYSISSLNENYYEGDEVSFEINLLNENKIVKEVKANEEVLVPVNDLNYKFIMPASDVDLAITLEDKKEPIPEETTANYNIIYDLGDRKTAKLLESNEVLFNTFSYVGGGSSIIESVDNFEYIYGGGYGGSGENKWFKGDMLKLGTQSVNGHFTLNLSHYVKGIKIKGFTSATNAKLRVGDASSSDWEGQTFDNKTSEVTCESLAIADKENVSNNVETTISLEFPKTNKIKFSSNKKPIYITAIEFNVVNE